MRNSDEVRDTAHATDVLKAPEHWRTPGRSANSKGEFTDGDGAPSLPCHGLAGIQIQLGKSVVDAFGLGRWRLAIVGHADGATLSGAGAIAFHRRGWLLTLVGMFRPFVAR